MNKKLVFGSIIGIVLFFVGVNVYFSYYPYQPIVTGGVMITQGKNCHPIDLLCSLSGVLFRMRVPETGVDPTAGNQFSACWDNYDGQSFYLGTYPCSDGSTCKLEFTINGQTKTSYTQYSGIAWCYGCVNIQLNAGDYPWDAKVKCGSSSEVKVSQSGTLHVKSGTPACTDECGGSGDSWCYGSTVQKCYDSDNDGCTEITNIDYCSGSEVCRQSGSSAWCETPAPSCTPAWECKDSTHRIYKNSDCSLSNEQFCEFGCDAGMCKSAPNYSGNVKVIW